jgi:hypothetical protein
VFHVNGTNEFSTIYDFVTVALFAGLVILFLQRSTAPEPQDHMYQYAPPAVGIAFANWLGNHGQDAFAIGVILASIVYVIYVLKPFNLKQ